MFSQKYKKNLSTNFRLVFKIKSSEKNRKLALQTRPYNSGNHK